MRELDARRLDDPLVTHGQFLEVGKRLLPLDSLAVRTVAFSHQTEAILVGQVCLHELESLLALSLSPGHVAVEATLRSLEPLEPIAGSLNHILLRLPALVDAIDVVDDGRMLLSVFVDGRHWYLLAVLDLWDDRLLDGVGSHGRLGEVGVTGAGSGTRGSHNGKRGTLCGHSHLSCLATLLGVVEVPLGSLSRGEHLPIRRLLLRHWLVEQPHTLELLERLIPHLLSLRLDSLIHDETLL